ncbi:MAG TPA: hypothetical protein VMZ28_24750 [Kofleriaceae bacterium]|nr:hypothetical protein [Kofleriaceae bacterium]
MRNALIIIALAGLCGCGASFEQSTPGGFVELEDQERYDYRATTADGLVIAVRELDHEPKGEVSFWVDAISNHMRQRGGYALIAKRNVRTAAGHEGVQLRFGHDQGSRPFLYYVTVFVTDDHIYLLEAGGSAEQMKQRSRDVDWAVEHFQID